LALLADRLLTAHGLANLLRPTGSEAETVLARSREIWSHGATVIVVR
jgi:hypothetical protein